MNTLMKWLVGWLCVLTGYYARWVLVKSAEGECSVCRIVIQLYNPSAEDMAEYGRAVRELCSLGYQVEETGGKAAFEDEWS